MFERYRIKRNRFLPILRKVMEGQEFGRLLAEQGLKELCVVLGDKVDLIVSISVKNMENYVFSTLPEDEAGYYFRNPDETGIGSTGTRAEGKRTLKSGLGVKGVLSGVWVLEVPDRAGEEEILEYKDLVPIMKAFLYCCFLAEAYEDEQERDCFTGLAGERVFWQELRNIKEGFLLAVRVFWDKETGEGLNGTVRKAAGCCSLVCPGKAYRIGPDVVSVLYYGDKEGAVATMQELMHALPGGSFLMESLSETDKDIIYERIRNWAAECGSGMPFLRSEGVYPKLPVFDEEAV